MNRTAKRLPQAPPPLGGFASAQSTAGYFDRLSEFLKQEPSDSWMRVVTPDKISISRLGFGGYRIRRGVFTHTEALRRAILTGTNVIDTASNYSDGASEYLIGDVIRDLHRSSIRREELMIITKGGYIQGTGIISYSGKKFKTLIEKSTDVLHCIDPDFLTLEVEQSARRLGVETIDAYLIQNPELHLERLIASGVPEPEAHDKYRELIILAFNRLEELKEYGRIGRYGISTNDIAYCHTIEFNKLYRQASPGFQVLQLPVNLIEHLPVSENNLCNTYDRLWVIGHRPFNAILRGELFRLAGPVKGGPGDESLNPCLELEDLRREILSLEGEIIDSHDGITFRFDDRNPSFSSIISRYQGSFKTPEQLEHTLTTVIGALKQSINRMNLISVNDYQRHRG